MKSQHFWVDHLNLRPHPEGGYFTETYRTSAPEGQRAASTGIYFLLPSHDVSHLHRIDADEMWHFYEGSALTVHIISESGEYSSLSIGDDPDKGQAFQGVVPAGVWFGATVDEPDGYALVGCTVAPGFEFGGFELADRADMLDKFPGHSEIIKRLTPDRSQ